MQRLLTTVLLACSGSADPTGATDDPSPATGDTGTALAQEVGLWTCPERIDAPSDAVGFRDAAEANGLGLLAFFDEVEAVAVSWVDEACLAGCTPTSCDVQGCVTADGATVDYRLESVEDTDAFYPEQSTILSVVVVPPAGEPWTELRLDRTLLASDGYEYSYSSTDVSATWSGTLDPRWPADASVTGRYLWGSGIYTNPTIYAWDDGACAWTVNHQRAGYEPEDWRITVSGPSTGEVYVKRFGTCDDRPTARAYVDGVEVDMVFYDTWTPSACE